MSVGIGGGVFGKMLASQIAAVLGFTPADAAKTVEVIASSGQAAAVLSGTAEVALATIAIPAMGAKDILRITSLWSYTNSANAKTLRVRLGGLAGTAIFATAPTTTAQAAFQQNIYNSNATNVQKMFNSSAPFSITTGALAAAAVQTNAGFDLVLSGQPANAGETITLEGYTVELIRNR